LLKISCMSFIALEFLQKIGYFCFINRSEPIGSGSLKLFWEKLDNNVQHDSMISFSDSNKIFLYNFLFVCLIENTSWRNRHVFAFVCVNCFNCHFHNNATAMMMMGPKDGKKTKLFLIIKTTWKSRRRRKMCASSPSTQLTKAFAIVCVCVCVCVL